MHGSTMYSQISNIRHTKSPNLMFLHEDTSVHEERSAECTDVSEWPLSASDLTMHDTSCFNP